MNVLLWPSVEDVVEAPVTWPRAFSTVAVHPLPLLLVLLAGGWYGWALRRMRRVGGGWPRSLTVWFYSGLLCWLVATCSIIGAYHQVLFSMRSVQIVVLLMVVPQLLAHGLPATLARDTMGPAARQRASRVLHARPSELITHPIVGVVVVLGLPLGLYGASRWYTASLTNHLIDELTQLALLMGGLHYFWTRLQRDPVPRLYPQYVTVALTFADIILDALVPLALIIIPSVYAMGYYSSVGRDWGPSLQADQYTGAGLLWFLGDVAGVPFLLLSMQQFWRRDQAEARVIDAQLDRKLPLTDDETTAGSAAARTRPWWYDDPTIKAHLHLPDPDDTAPR